ncbi:MAG: DUF4926 domain-containing protein [Gemmatimonadota bacterium]|nr:MAG: DUF4926 domain-containing protein [Gemmatimonadota bacterium]
MIREHDTVVLTRDIPEQSLLAGDVGAVVSVYETGRAFEVEFVAGDGRTIAVLTLKPGDVRAVNEAEILHVRAIS